MLAVDQAEVAHVMLWWLFGLVALGVDVWVAWRIWQAPAERFRYGSWSKLGWLIAIFGITWHLSVIALPVGAILARSRLWTAPGPPAGLGPIPMAEGEYPPEGWS